MVGFCFSTCHLHLQLDVNDNKIPEAERPAQPTADGSDVVLGGNEIPPLRNGAGAADEHPSNVLMAHASEDSIFHKTEVLAGQCASSLNVKGRDMKLGL